MAAKTCDVLILNTAVLDLRSPDFTFTRGLVGPGGLAKCPAADMPRFTPAQYAGWIGNGRATAGGSGNSAPLLARAGLRVAAGGYLGAGDRGGLDIQGRAFCDTLAASGVDTSELVPHPSLPTGITFICEVERGERGGIAYFPNANDDFDFARFKGSVERLRPSLVYYMYSGLSDRGDANGGRDLAAFVRWCRAQGCLVIADCHTLTGNPQELIRAGAAVPAYHLLEPLLPELDIFFTSLDEARMIGNTLWAELTPAGRAAPDYERLFLEWLTARFWRGEARARLSGVTFAQGAVETHAAPAGAPSAPRRVVSRYLAGEVVDLVGAGDAFRTGLIAYVVRHADAFRAGALDVAEAVQMGNLFASLFIKAPLADRYGNFRPLDTLLRVVRGGRSYAMLDALLAEVGPAPLDTGRSRLAPDAPSPSAPVISAASS